MPKLKINAPDGKVLRIDVPEGTSPDQYDALVDDVLADYETSQVETPGALKSGALGVMSGIPGAQSLVSGIEAMGDKTFEEAQKHTEIQKDKAWEEHPVAYGTGKAAGIVGSSLAIPGGAVSTIPRAIATGAAMGGLSGLDTTTDTSDIPENIAKGAGMGGAFGGAAKGIVEPAVGAVVNKFAPALGKRAVASLGKPTLEDVESYLKNPEAIRGALTNPQMAEKLAGAAEDVGKVSGHLSAEARSGLSSTKAPLTVDNILETFEAAKGKYLTNGMPATAADETAVKALDGQLDRLIKIAETNNGEIPETTLQEVIHKLQDSINANTWGNPEASAAQEAMKNLSGRLNSMLKKSNEAYGEAMIPSAEAAGLKGDLVGKFGLETAPTGKVSATEATNTKMGNVLKESKTESQDMLGKLNEMTGIDFLELARNAKTREAFEGEGASQGLNVIAHAGGYGLGALSNIPGGRLVGSLVGGVVGHNIDGGQVAKKILDAYISGSSKFANSASKKALSKYGPLLVQAAKQGGNQLAATHFVLGTSDPEYQALASELEGVGQ